MGPKGAIGHPDRDIARLAAGQHGVVLLAQLVAAGITERAVVRRVRSGHLHRIHRGVYAVGHPRLWKEGRWLAAVLACGEGAVLGHRGAAALWDLMPAPSGPVDVTVPGSGGRRKRPGIAVHRSTTLEPSCCTCERQIPVTTPARTIDDRRRVLRADRFDAVLRRAELLRLDAGRQEGFEPDPTRSELEHRFLRLCRRHRIPRPEVNVRLGRFLVDFLWRDERLVVETDGYRFHRTRSAFESDRARDVELRLLGYQVVRFTHMQLKDESSWVARTLRALLA
jgi:very-short-patch-repair endonuclease